MAIAAVAPATRPRATATTLAYAGLGVTSVCWAAGFIAGKVAVDAMTPLAVAAWRYAIAAAILLPFAVTQRPARGLRAAAGPLALMIVCGGVVYPWLFLTALAHTSAVNTALLIALNPAITLLLTPLVGERYERRRLAGVCLALVGAAVVITRGDPAAVVGSGLHAGDALALAAAVMWAVVNLASRGVVDHLAPAFTNCVVYGVGGCALSLLGRPETLWSEFHAAPAAAVAGVFVLAGLSSVLAGQLFLIGIRTVGVGRTVVFVYLVPVLTALLATTLLGEPFGAAQAAGGAAVLAGVYWTTRV